MALSTGDAFKQMAADEDAVQLTLVTLLRLQQCILSIMEDIIFVCEQQGYEYLLSGGSCLGALRHQGFIPWDDDADLMMPRASYDALLEYFRTNKADEYDVLDPQHTPGYGLGFAQIRKRGTVARKRDDFGQGPFGVPVDIFCIDNVPDGALTRRWHSFCCTAYAGILSCCRSASYSEDFLELTKHDPALQASFKKKIAVGRLFGWRSLDSWARKADKCFSSCKNKQSEYMTIPAGRHHYNGEMLLRKDWLPGVNASFEGHSWLVPSNADAYLTKLHGAWQEEPDADAREHHVYMQLEF